MFYNLIAEIAKSRKKKKDVAGALGISVNTLNNKLEGRTEFRLDEIQLLVSMFNGRLSIDYLFSRTEN